MGLFQRHRGKKPHRRTFTKAELASLRSLKYAEDFNLPEEAETLYRISQYADTGGRFIIKKRFGTSGYRSVFVVAFDHYPSRNQIAQEVYPKYGGGTYTVHPEGRAGQFASHTFGGPSKYEPYGPKPKGRRGELDDETRRRLEDFLRDLEWKDPGLWHQVNLARLEKEWGIEIPRQEEHEPDWGGAGCSRSTWRTTIDQRRGTQGQASGNGGGDTRGTRGTRAVGEVVGGAHQAGELNWDAEQSP